MAVMVLSSVVQALHHLGDVISAVKDIAIERNTVVTALALAAATDELRRRATILVAQMRRVSRRNVYRVLKIR